jgi:hypothetical protein
MEGAMDGGSPERYSRSVLFSGASAVCSESNAKNAPRIQFSASRRHRQRESLPPLNTREGTRDQLRGWAGAVATCEKCFA